MGDYGKTLAIHGRFVALIFDLFPILIKFFKQGAKYCSVFCILNFVQIVDAHILLRLL